MRLLGVSISTLDASCQSSKLNNFLIFFLELGLQHDDFHNLQPSGLPLNETLLPNRLRELGYRAHGVGKVRHQLFTTNNLVLFHTKAIQFKMLRKIMPALNFVS